MEKIKTVGDAIVATSGILNDNHEPVLAAVECGFLFREKANDMNPSWDVHVGIHYGPVVAGIVGRQSLQFDMLGHTLNIAFRICDTTEKNEILISNDAWMTVRGKLKGKSRGILERVYESVNLGCLFLFFDTLFSLLKYRTNFLNVSSKHC